MPLVFDRFRLDPANQRLEGPSGVIAVNPKAFDVLRVLVERHGRLVSKEELLDAVWPDAHVADGVLKVGIAELRKALGDSATAPRFIETVHRRGYRFVAPVAAVEPVGASPRSQAVVVWPLAEDAPPRAEVGLVGRAEEMRRLEAQMARALAGERQVVFVQGEAGAGKTALVERFVADVGRRHVVAITGSRCLERFGSTEAYMPVLEAVGRLAGADAVTRSLLRRYAPTWLAQLPWLVEDADRDRLAGALAGVARERMLRELAEFVEALTADVPLVLVLDDLHWSDPSTIDLLALLAERRERARLLVLATFRPAELVLTRHPLRQVALRLVTRGRSTELVLDDLPLAAVAEYLERRFAGIRFPAVITKAIRERTDGNALFLVALVDHLVSRGVLGEAGGPSLLGDELRAELAAVPESLRRLIEQQLERLATDDRRLLESASLIGTEFSAAAAAAAAECSPADAEERCESLAATGRFIRHVGAETWPNGTVAGRYAFRHALYRETLAAGVSSRRRRETQLRIGSTLEAAYGARAGEIAAVLALHFEAGGDRLRALRHRRVAAETAAGRHALVEAEAHLESGLRLLEDVPASAERDREELLLQSALGATRMATRGYAAPQVVAAYTRVLELSGGAPEGSASVPVTWGLWSFHLVRGELDRALALARQTGALAATSGEPLARLVAHHGLWTTHFFRGELAESVRHLEAGEPLYDLVHDRRAALAYGQDQKMAALAHRAIISWYLGRIDHALVMSRAAVDHARALGHPMSLAFAMSYAGWLRILRREPQACLEAAEAVLAYATAESLPHWIPGTLHVRGWARAEQGDVAAGIADMEQGLAMMEATGGGLGMGPRTLDLAVAQARAGDLAVARMLVERARSLAAETGERYSEAEIHRFDAELVLAEAGGPRRASRDVVGRAEDRLVAAVACARRQGARTLELRAATALARLLGRGARGQAARAALAELHAWFTEGVDTADLREARSVLGASERPSRPRR